KRTAGTLDSGRCMKPFAAAVILLLAQPAVAHAGVSLVARDVPLHGDRALMSTGTPRFDLVGVHWRGTGNVSFRTRSFAGRWSADESIRRAPPQFAASVNNAIVHHTAGTNSYSKSQSAAIVRGIEVYHVKGNGWNDIGYNALVDKYGQVFEGRYGGMDKNVVGAHAEGFNTGSVGVALIGTYQSAAPTTAEKTALADLL